MPWRSLRLSESAGVHLPALLISTTFTSDSYTIHLSDLTYIWCESLDRRAIIRRSREESTSIDPSDPDQFSIFLEKLKVGLAGARKDDTALALTINADADRPSIILNVTVKLPGGLPALEWPIRLSTAPQSFLTSQLTLPLLRAQQARIQEVSSLTEVLKEKDHVIQKLLDKLEAQGTEIGQVFPQAVGKGGRKVDRKKAEERVRGLGPFDLSAWRNGLSYEEAQDTKQLIGNVFMGNTEPLRTGPAQLPSEESENWWESIKGITVNLDSGRISTNGPPKLKKQPIPEPVLHDQDSFEDDDAFQVQATPPRVTNPKVTSEPVADDLTDDDDLDAPSQRSKVPDSYPISQHVAKSPSPKPKPAKKLGKLGGKKEIPKPPAAPLIEAETDFDNDLPVARKSTTLKRVSPKASPPAEAKSDTASDATPPQKTYPKRRKLAPSEDDSTADEETSPIEPNLTQQSSPPKHAISAKPKKKLGAIGGNKQPPPPPEPEPEPEAEPAAIKDSPPKPKKSKIGQIGGRKKVTTAHATPAPDPTTPEASVKIPTTENTPAKGEGSEKRGRMSVKREPERDKTPSPRETSLERADRKREQLKRELEAKAKAPVKKKRKF